MHLRLLRPAAPGGAAAPLIRKYISPPSLPINRLTAEMWADYRAFKAAGLLSEWRRKWAAYLPN